MNRPRTPDATIDDAIRRAVAALAAAGRPPTFAAIRESARFGRNRLSERYGALCRSGELARTRPGPPDHPDADRLVSRAADLRAGGLGYREVADRLAAEEGRPFAGCTVRDWLVEGIRPTAGSSCPRPRAAPAPMSGPPTPEQIRERCREIREDDDDRDDDGARPAWFGPPATGPDLGSPSLRAASPSYRRLVEILGRARP